MINLTLVLQAFAPLIVWALSLANGKFLEGKNDLILYLYPPHVLHKTFHAVVCMVIDYRMTVKWKGCEEIVSAILSGSSWKKFADP